MRALLTVVLLVGGCKSLLGLDDGVVTPSDSADIDADATGPWWNPAFRFRHEITFDTTGLQVPLAGVPLLVRLPATAIGSTTGSDLRFIEETHTQELPFEIDWISDLGAAAWVEVDLAATTRFYVYAGSDDAVSTSNGAGVFGAFVSVHHLEALTDSSGHGHTGAGLNANQTPASAAGLIGNALEYDGENDTLTLLDADTPYDFTTEMSASAWVEVAAFNNPYQAIFSKGDSSWRVQRDSATDHLSFGTSAGMAADDLLGTTTVTGSAWHHVAVSFTAGVKRLYLDGVLDVMRAQAGPIDTNNFATRIGGNSELGMRYWKGKIDEARISGMPRSAARIRADFEMVHTPGRLVVGARESL